MKKNNLIMYLTIFLIVSFIFILYFSFAFSWKVNLIAYQDLSKSEKDMLKPQTLANCYSTKSIESVDACNFMIARDTRNLTKCSKLSLNIAESTCYLFFAVERNESSICNLINNQSISAYCIATLTNNPVLCDNIESDKEKGQCITGIAISTKNPSICQKIPNSYPQSFLDFCVDQAS